MVKKVSSLLIITLLLLGALNVAYVARPTYAQDNVLRESLGGKNLESSLPSTVVDPSAGQRKTGDSSNGALMTPKSGLDLADLGQSGDLAYLNGNKTRLVVGVGSEKSDSVFELEKIAAHHNAKIVNTVSMKGKTIAIVFELPLVSVTSFVQGLQATDLASYVEPNMKAQAQIVPNDPYWNMQWGPQKIEADWAWNTTIGDPSILVAVVDTGIYYPHPDIAANYVALGQDWVNNDADPIDDNGHGTHCAGIIAGVLNNSEGIAGLAQVRVMAEKVLDSGGGGYYDWVANGIIHATDSGADIISMSLAGYGESELLHEAVKYAHDAGVLVVAAAANDNTNLKAYPAAYDEVIAVAATDQNDNKAWFSNWGDWIELAAPGVDIYSTVPFGYEQMSGTSMACPHVAGIAALVWSEYANRTRDWVRLWLRYTAEDLGTPGFDVYYGYGRINAKRAIQMLPPAHELIVFDLTTPSYVKPGFTASVNGTILNFGEDEANVTVQLLANDTVVNSLVVDFLPGGNFTTVGIPWTPTVEGSYNVTFYVVPVVGEANLDNNALQRRIFVGFPILAAVLHSAGNVVGEIITNWQALSNDWYLFGDKMIFVDYTSLNKMDITYEDIVATEADVLIISCASDPYAGWQFLDSEIAAITQYVREGHGLIVTSGTFYYSVPNNNKLAPLLGLNDTIWWGTSSTDLMHLLNATHPFFTDVPDPLVFPGVTSTLPSDGQWDSNELVDGTYLAIGHYKESAITTYRGLVYISPILEIIPPYYHHHLQLLYNAIRWSRYEKPAHDLSVTLQAPEFLATGESVLLNATVSNLGSSNETNVELQLLVNGTQLDSVFVPELPSGASYTLTHLFGPVAAGMKYNVTAYAPPVQGESDTLDNEVTKLVSVSFYARTYSLPQWVSGGTPMGWHADDSSWEYTLPFSFPFYGVSYDRIYISSNGLITFTYFDSDLRNGVPELAGKRAMGPAWDDWVTYDPYDIYIWQNSTHMGIRWEVRHYGSSIVANFETILQVNGVIQFNYGYNDGPVSATIGISDGNGDFIAEETIDLNYTDTIVFTPPLPEHELGVYLQTPGYLQPNESTLLNASVMNLGLNNESLVELQLLINDTQVDSVIVPELQVGQSYTLVYAWSPEFIGTYNVTAYAPPVLSEESTGNNVATKLVNVRETKGRVLWDQTRGDTLAPYSVWIGNLTERGYVIDSLNAGPVTPALLQGYDVLVIAQAYSAYSSDEILAIQSFVTGGGGLLVIGDDYPYLYNDLTGFADITWASGGMSGSTTDITEHPVTAGVSSVYLAGPVAFMSVDGATQDLVRDSMGNIMLAVSEPASGKVLGFADEDSLRDYAIGQEDNLLLANNMIDWLSTTILLEHDLAVSLEAPKILETGTSTLLNATVRNRGLNNETNVELQLLINSTQVSSVLIPELPVGAVYTLNFNFSPSGWGKKYNVTAYAPPLQDENTTSNNFVTKIVRLPFYARTYVSPQWVGGGTPMGWHADDSSWEYTLPFSFPFYGVSYDRIYISSNGLITFDGPDSSLGNSISWLAGKRAMAPAWDDWVTSDPYDIYIWQNLSQIGIRWEVRHYGSSIVANFETILQVNGVIQFNYGYNDGLISATIGVSDGTSDFIAEDIMDLNYVNSVVFLPPAPETGGAHDVAVTALDVSPNDVYQGWVVNANVTVANFGNATDTFAVSLYYDNNLIATQFVSNLQPNETSHLVFSWNTTFAGAGQNYTIKAVASTVPGETNVLNNVFVDGTVEVRMICDITKDGVVDILDCILVSQAFGATPYDNQWNLFCDINQDNIVNILDTILIANHFGDGYSHA